MLFPSWTQSLPFSDVPAVHVHTRSSEASHHPVFLRPDSQALRPTPGSLWACLGQSPQQSIANQAFPPSLQKFLGVLQGIMFIPTAMSYLHTSRGPRPQSSAPAARCLSAVYHARHPICCLQPLLLMFPQNTSSLLLNIPLESHFLTQPR